MPRNTKIPDAGSVIAIDGTAASGKGTLADQLARHFDFFRCDSGALYRSAALRVIETGADPDEIGMKAGLKVDLKIGLKIDKCDVIDYIAAFDPTTLVDKNALRAQEVSTMAARIARNPALRQVISALQKQWGRQPPCGKFGMVVDGRDATTVVFVDSPYKLFLDARLDVRSRRRYEELLQREFSVTYENVRRDIEQRDRDDRERDVAPLHRAEDVWLIDTSEKDADQVFEDALKFLSSKGLTQAGTK